MLPPRLLSASLALFVFALASAGNAPAPERALPVGEWSVEFANGVVETCAIRKDGTAPVKAGTPTHQFPAVGLPQFFTLPH